jgi:hypothetical protein
MFYIAIALENMKKRILILSMKMGKISLHHASTDHSKTLLQTKCLDCLILRIATQSSMAFDYLASRHQPNMTYK